MKGILRAISEVIFPTLCQNCDMIIGSGENGLCRVCLSQIKYTTPPLCICCGVPFASSVTDSHLCADCIAVKPPFSIARAVGLFEATLLDAVHRFKYGHNMVMGEMLGGIMADYQYPGLFPEEYDIIIPVPLHPQRLRERGFNQSVILARKIADKYSLPMDFMTLQRHQKTAVQVELGKKEREKNVKGAFSMKYPAKVKEKKILLVDDVYTTGSTLKECARTVMGAGAKDVAVITLARVM